MNPGLRDIYIDNKLNFELPLIGWKKMMHKELYLNLFRFIKRRTTV